MWKGLRGAGEVGCRAKLAASPRGCCVRRYESNSNLILGLRGSLCERVALL